MVMYPCRKGVSFGPSGDAAQAAPAKRRKTIFDNFKQRRSVSDVVNTEAREEPSKEGSDPWVTQPKAWVTQWKWDDPLG